MCWSSRPPAGIMKHATVNKMQHITEPKMSNSVLFYKHTVPIKVTLKFVQIIKNTPCEQTLLRK